MAEKEAPAKAWLVRYKDGSTDVTTEEWKVAMWRENGQEVVEMVEAGAACRCHTGAGGVDDPTQRLHAHSPDDGSGDRRGVSVVDGGVAVK